MLDIACRFLYSIIAVKPIKYINILQPTMKRMMMVTTSAETICSDNEWNETGFYGVFR